MAILAFQKPDKVVMLESTPTCGRFEFRPLEPGFGTTIGNALRRILLSSLEGFAINTIRINGVEHEFSTVPGVLEDVTNIILNLKQVRFKQIVNEFDTEKVSITVEKTIEFKAGDISKVLTGFEVLNPELVICHLDPKASMTIELSINKGRGYVPSEENREFCTDVNTLPIDSIYTLRLPPTVPFILRRLSKTLHASLFSTSCSSQMTRLLLRILMWRRKTTSMRTYCVCASYSSSSS